MTDLAVRRHALEAKSGILSCGSGRGLCRDEWAQKQIETMEAQLAAQEARIKEKKESIQKLKEHRNEIKTNWKKNKVQRTRARRPRHLALDQVQVSFHWQLALPSRVCTEITCSAHRDKTVGQKGGRRWSTVF